MRQRSGVSACVALALCASSATAKTSTGQVAATAAGTPAGQAAYAARLAAARALVDTLRIESQLRASQLSVDADANTQVGKLLASQNGVKYQLDNPQGFEAIRGQAVKLLADDRREMFNEMLPLLIDGEARRYADHFSLDELHGLNAFYHSPLGQRLIAEQPAVARDNDHYRQTILQPLSAAHGAALLPKLTAILAPILRQSSTPPAAKAGRP